MNQAIDWAANAERVLVGYAVLYVTTEAPQIIDGGVDNLTWKDGIIVLAFIVMGILTRMGVWSKNSYLSAEEA